MAKQLYDIRNYPKNPGTAQSGRYDRVLMGEKVAIIEHNIADYIVFAHKLSAFLKYFNDNDVEKPAGNWQNFLVNDVSYHLAVIVADKPEYWEAAWQELMEFVETNTIEENKKYFTWRFDFVYSLVGRLTETFIYSKQLISWHNDLGALYTTANLDIIYELVEKYFAASKDLISDNAGVFLYKDMKFLKRLAVVTGIETNRSTLSDILGTDTRLDNDGEFIFGDSTKIIDKINAATEYLDDLAKQLLRIYRRVNDFAEDHLKLSLTNFNEHQPHVGLFYAFLQLLEEHKADINSLLLRHLDYYYRQVLAVKAKPYQPSKAYVTFEPAKNINEFLIKSGSLLLAGKDAKAKDIFYKTQQDIVVNRAELRSVKSFTVIRNKPGKPNERSRTGPLGIFACSQANSADGNGKPLQAGQSWDAFRVTSGEGNTDAQIGLSFYSALLREAPQEKGAFIIKITFPNQPPFDWLNEFTTQYGSIKIYTDKEPLKRKLKGNYASGIFSIEFDVPEKTKISGNFPNTILLFGKNEGEVNDDFFEKIKALQAAPISKFEITLKEKPISVKKAETVLGMTDLSASFPAFGGVPKDGSWFKIIQPILKGKTISDLDLKIEWASKTERDFSVTVEYPDSEEKVIKPGYSIVAGVSESNLNDLISPTTSAVFTDEFIKIILRSDNDLGHRTYAEELAGAVTDDYITVTPLFAALFNAESKTAEHEIKKTSVFERSVAASTGTGKQVKRPFPKPPYTPVIKNITITCNLTETISTTEVCYQYPHGYKKNGAGNLYLIPATPFEGELYIGFKDLKPAQSLNVLIQVEEGTSDPTLPDPELTWNFLHNNQWMSFDSAQFKDGTKGLIQSGIITFISPDYDCTNNTLLPAGEFWIRAAIGFNQANAVCRFFSVNPQAVLAQFTDNDNVASGLGNNLPANTISQLFPKQSSIKKVLQPYASFGGRKEEENEKIYARTSERLRHKSRAINAWDYEHIILEAFPEIYKVKVLNHACLKGKVNEKKVVSKAGELIILVAGKTTAQSSLYKPLVSKSRLTSIKEFIMQRASPFAKIDVMNPLFEEVSVDTIVTFTENIKDEGFYERELQNDINRFLSPWAFEEGIEPEFGGTIYRAALLDFIEELPYVDFIEKLEIIHQKSVTGDMAAASSPASILISAPLHKVNGNLKTAVHQNILSNLNY